MLDTRSGRLLTSQSFHQPFSQLQSASGGVTYFLHQYAKDGLEKIELHFHDLAANASRLVTSFIHRPHPKVRPSQWRASLSADSTLLAYQQDPLQPVITVANGQTGEVVSTIRWKGDLTALPVFFHPSNEYIAVPLANWDAQYSYRPERKLLLAETKTGRIAGIYDAPQYISQVHFDDNGMTLITENPLTVGKITLGSPTITWTRLSDQFSANTHLQLFQHGSLAGFVSRPAGSEKGEYQQLQPNAYSHFPLDKGYLPIGLRGNMLVSERNITREYPTWLQKLNERVHSIANRYLVPPAFVSVLFQDAQTGQLRQEMQFPFRNVDEYLTRRVAGSNKLAVVFKKDDHLGVDFHDIFPFWTTGRLILLSIVVTLLLYFCLPGHRQKNRNESNAGTCSSARTCEYAA